MDARLLAGCRPRSVTGGGVIEQSQTHPSVNSPGDEHGVHELNSKHTKHAGHMLGTVAIGNVCHV